MKRGIIVALAIAIVGIAACGKNEAATEKCKASADGTACEACCKANGANGYTFTGAGSCGCLGGGK